MSGPRQQITGLSREATLDSERQPEGTRTHKHGVLKREHKAMKHDETQ